METVDWPQTGERVRGAYLGNPFEGVVTGVGFEKAPLGRSYAIRFDAPVNVSKSKLMTIMRQSVRALIAADGASIDDKGRPNGIMTLMRA
jgi:Glyoxalase superfamily protein